MVQYMTLGFAYFHVLYKTPNNIEFNGALIHISINLHVIGKPNILYNKLLQIKKQ